MLGVPLDQVCWELQRDLWHQLSAVPGRWDPPVCLCVCFFSGIQSGYSRTTLVSLHDQSHEVCLLLIPLQISASKAFMGTSEQVHRGWELSELAAAIESGGKYCCEVRVRAVRAGE